MQLGAVSNLSRVSMCMCVASCLVYSLPLLPATDFRFMVTLYCINGWKMDSRMGGGGSVNFLQFPKMFHFLLGNLFTDGAVLPVLRRFRKWLIRG